MKTKIEYKIEHAYQCKLRGKDLYRSWCNLNGRACEEEFPEHCALLKFDVVVRKDMRKAMEEDVIRDCDYEYAEYRKCVEEDFVEELSYSQSENDE